MEGSPPAAQAALAVLATKIRRCRRCRLWRTRLRAVAGEGPPTAAVMIVGEGPGRQEDAQGRPFVGAAGRFLNVLLGEAGLRREEVFITNVVKSHPTNSTMGPNRPPVRDEAAACRIWLEEELAILNPRLIVTLGAHALAAFDPGVKLSAVRGQPIARGGWRIFPLYHPASRVPREVLRRDARKIRALLAPP